MQEILTQKRNYPQGVIPLQCNKLILKKRTQIKPKNNFHNLSTQTFETSYNISLMQDAFENHLAAGYRWKNFIQKGKECSRGEYIHRCGFHDGSVNKLRHFLCRGIVYRCHEQVIHCCPTSEVAGDNAKMLTQVMLGIQIHSQDSLALFVDIRADIDGGGGLSNPAFARDKRDDFTHRCYLHFHTVFRVVQTLFGVVFRGTMYLIRGECAVIRLRKPLVLLTFSPNPIRIRVPNK